MTNITQISAGWFHILARRSDGTVWAWGNNSNGELGDGTAVNKFSPVTALNVSNIVVVSGGDGHSSALASNGMIWKWGLNDLGELGNGTTNATANPFPAQIITNKFGNGFSNVVMMAARDYHNIAVKADGSVWMWGANDQGQCGEGTTNNDCWSPVPVAGLGARLLGGSYYGQTVQIWSALLAAALLAGLLIVAVGAVERVVVRRMGAPP